MHNNKIEQTLVLIKPDALVLSLSGYVLSQLSETHTGLMIAGTKIVNVSRMLAEEHYIEHQGKGFFPALIEYIMGKIHYPNNPDKQRVKAFVYQGDNAVQKVRKIAGPTNPHVAREQKPGCIRSLGTLIPIQNEQGETVGSRMDNLIHASANQEEAEREIKLWFTPNDIPPLMRMYDCQLCDEFFYYKDGRIFSDYEKGSVCVLAPGNIAWKTDLESLRLILNDAPAPSTLSSIVAKYLINEHREDCTICSQAELIHSGPLSTSWSK